VDVVIIAEGSALAARQARAAFEATFDARQTHALASRLPAYPRVWGPVYRRLATDVGVKAQTFEDGLELAESFINPLLNGSAGGLWAPDQCRWSGADV
jgi:hypothetical protein